MPAPPLRRGPRRKRGTARRAAPAGESPPLVEIVLSGVDGHDWVTETLTDQGRAFRLLACRPTDRGRRRLLRLFEVQTGGEGIGPLVRRLRSRVPARDIATASLGPDRTLLRVSVPMPPSCSAAFDLGDFCISCPFVGGTDGAAPPPWRLLVPKIVDARHLLSSAAPAKAEAGARPALVRAGAYRRRWGLTGRQERALRTALEIGYFDYPRKASLAALASRLGVGRSTALELLRKGTTKLAAERFLAEPPVDRPS